MGLVSILTHRGLEEKDKSTDLLMEVSLLSPAALLWFSEIAEYAPKSTPKISQLSLFFFFFSIQVSTYVMGKYTYSCLWFSSLTTL